MSRTELLPEGLVILPSGIAPGPAGGETGQPSSDVPHGAQGEPATGVFPTPDETVGMLKSGVAPSRENSGHLNRSHESFGELCAAILCRTGRTSSSVLVSSRAAVRNDKSEVVWLLTPKAISHLFGYRAQLGHKDAQTLSSRAPGNGERELVGSAKP